MTNTNPSKPIQDDEESQWSLSSLEELKGLDLNQLKEEEDNDHMEHQPQQPKSKVQAKFPPMQDITTDTKLYEVGKIVSKVGELLIIEANNSINLVDLDNWLFSADKKCLGFVIDIFGRVDNPYYAIKLLEQINAKIGTLDHMLGVVLFYAEGCKTLTEEDIRSIKEKSSVNKEAIEGDDSSSESDDDNQFRSNMVMVKRERERSPKRRGSFEEEPYHRRERTREKKHERKFQNQRGDRRRHYDWRNRDEVNRDRQQNQAYLEGMYNTYYSQMMQLYNGQNGMPLPKPPVFPMFQQQAPPQNSPFGPPTHNSPFGQSTQQTSPFAAQVQQQTPFAPHLQQQSSPFGQVPQSSQLTHPTSLQPHAQQFPSMGAPVCPPMSIFPQGAFNHQSTMFPTFGQQQKPQ